MEITLQLDRIGGPPHNQCSAKPWKDCSGAKCGHNKTGVKGPTASELNQSHNRPAWWRGKCETYEYATSHLC